MTSRHDLLDRLRAQGILRDERVAAAMETIPRDFFLPPELRADAGLDAPLSIGRGQTISAPHMVAMMAEALGVRPGDRILEVGGGSGYHAAVLAWLAMPGGRVVTLEYDPDLAEAARLRIAALDLPVDLRTGDGAFGAPDAAPFDRISVAAASPRVPPPLLEQLTPGGVLVIPIGPPDLQRLVRLTKLANGHVRTEDMGACRFVPLRGPYGW